MSAKESTSFLAYMTDLERQAFEQALEANFLENLEYLSSRTVKPELGGYIFEIHRLDADWEGSPRFGYRIEKTFPYHQEAGGSYETAASATRAALARIETLAFDGRQGL